MKILTAYLSRFAGICFRKLTHLFQKDRYSSIAKCSARAYFFVQWDIPDRSVAFWGYQLAPHFWITEMRDLTKLLKLTPSISWTKTVLVKASCRVQYVWYSGFHTIPMIRQLQNITTYYLYQCFSRDEWHYCVDSSCLSVRIIRNNFCKLVCEIHNILHKFIWSECFGKC